MHFSGSLRRVFVRDFLSLHSDRYCRPPKYWPFLSGHSRVSLVLWKAQHTLEKRFIQPLSPLSFMTRTGIVLLCLPPASLHALTRLFSCPSLQRVPSRSISLFNFYDGELELGERFAHKDREVFFLFSRCVILTRPSEKSSDSPCDIWQLGITFAQ